ncbi:MAG: hypothetical protein KKE20_06060, partial [Nanoarchaeota archaeon]|nr:hypothetical protein [Nanoarchaeota archaeon]
SARAEQDTFIYKGQNLIINSVDKFVRENQEDLERIASQLYQGRLPSQEIFVPEYTQNLIDLSDKELNLSKGLGSLCNEICNRVLLSSQGALGLVAIHYFCTKIPNIDEIRKVA